MTPDASSWRTSQYKHLDALTASDLAWEWLRRNDAYEADFHTSATAPDDGKSLTDRIRRRWGLRFPRRPASSST